MRPPVRTLPPGSLPFAFPDRNRRMKPFRLKGLRLLFVSALFAGAFSAAAADWLVIASGAGDVLLVDRDGFRRSGGNVEALTLHSHEREVAATTETPAYRSERARLRFDCGAGTFTVTERVFFSAALGDGRELGRKTQPEPAVAATTQREKMLLEMACSR